MKNRKERLPIIVYLLTNKCISTQEDLLSELSAHGFYITQATLSRDLKQLKTCKVPDGKGGYRYMVTGTGDGITESVVTQAVSPGQSDPIIQSINRSANIIVIKTPASHASMLAHAYNYQLNDDVLAALAIGNAVIIILASSITSERVYSILTTVLNHDVVDRYRTAL